jgi:predicted Zn finger-like uncharacterized protein
MYTQCPQCQTCFRVAEAHLKAANGKVRCGSCKAIFDATKNLYDGIPGKGTRRETSTGSNASTTPASKPVESVKPTTPPAKKPVPPSSAPPVTTTEGFNEILPGGPEIPEHDHQHIDLSTPTDRSDAPDQSRFMQSIITENSQYNNLDHIGPIKIPGEADFTDSFIRFTDDEQDNEAGARQQEAKAEPETDFTDSLLRFADDDQDDETEARSEPLEPSTTPEEQLRSPYTDIEQKELPATTEEQAGIHDLYSAADEQLQKGEEALELGRAIEAMLENELSFDDEKPAKQTPEKPQNKPSLDPGLEQIRLNTGSEDGLELLDEPDRIRKGGGVAPLEHIHSEDIWSRQENKETAGQQPEKKIPEKKPEVRAEPDNIPEHDGKQDLHIDLSSDFGDFPDASQGDNSDDISQTEVSDEEDLEFDAMDALRLDRNKMDNDEAESVEGIIPSETEAVEDELPSMDYEIPKALRSSFESHEARLRPVGLTIAMVFGIIVLVIGLLGQAILFRSYQLANSYPSLEPVLADMCTILPCRYSGSTDVSKIEVLNRDMRSHPNQKNALLVSTAIVNKADYDQPYPVVAIKLFDLSGDTVATRYFEPEEYLDKLYSKFLLMEAGTPVHITLEILDPGDDAVNFEFSFL